MRIPRNLQTGGAVAEVHQAGAVDGVVITNTDALVVAYGRHKQAGDATVAVFPTSWSNGADKILVDKGIKNWTDLSGVTVHGAEFSVTHYLFYRGCQIAGCDYNSLKFEHLDPDKGAPRFAAHEKDFRAFGGWSPETFVVLDARKDVSDLFNSSKLGRYEITDIVVLGQSALNKVGGQSATKVLARSMREMIAQLNQRGPDARKQTLRSVSERFNNLSPTAIERAFVLTEVLPPESNLFDTPEFQENMKHVVDFTNAHKLSEGNVVPYAFGAKAQNPNAHLRFDGSYLR